MNHILRFLYCRARSFVASRLAHRFILRHFVDREVGIRDRIREKKVLRNKINKLDEIYRFA